MFESIKDKNRIKKLERENEIKQLEFDNEQLDIATKMLTEARNTVQQNPDYDELGDGWSILGKSNITALTEQEQNDLLVSVYNLYHTNTYARAIVSNLVKFTLGKGPIIIFDDENVKVKEVWEKFKKDNKFNLREKEIGNRTFRDGEVFLREFKNEKTNEEPSYKLRFIRANHIANSTTNTDKNTTYGIKTSPDDIEEVIEYSYVDDNKNLIETIPASQIIHFKIIADFDQKRGISILKVVAKKLKQYDEWLEDRIFLNKVRTAITLIKTVSGNAQQVKNIRDSQLSDQLLGQDRTAQKTPRRGTVITASKGVEYQMLSPNINAQDVKDDGRAMLLGVATGAGFPEMILTSDWSNSNYASTLVSQNPFVKNIEDWQDQFSTLYMEIVKRVIEYNIEFGELPADTKATCRVEFPPMITANLKEVAEAFEILFKYKVVSKKTWQGKMGLDSDIEEANMEDEEEDFMNSNPIPNTLPGQPNPVPVPGQANQKSPFNLPKAPINQYASKDQLIDYIDSGDWKSFKEEVEKIGGIPEEVVASLLEIIESI